MPRFAYVAKRSPGEVLQGVMEAESEAAVTARLQQTGHHPCSISRWREHASRNPFSLLRHRWVRLTDVAIFTRQLSDLVDAGLPIGRSLSIIAEQTDNVRLRDAVRSVQAEVEGGNSLSAALASYPRVFPPLTSTMVQAGEEGGVLPQVLAALADYYERSEELSGKVRAALAYPVFLTLVGSATVFVLMSFVVPNFVKLFEGLGGELPLPTRILIRVSLFLGSFWWALLLALFGMALLGWRASRTIKGRAAIDKVKLALPLLGPVLAKVDIARLMQNLAMLLEHGVPVLQALNAAGQTVRNTCIRSLVNAVSKAVGDGKGLGEPLKSSGYFPPAVTNLILVGYASGDLPAMLKKAAAMCDREVERTTQVMTRLLEPALIFILGGAVGLVVAGILLPVFRINVLVR